MKLKCLKMAGLLACTAGAMVAMPGSALANLVGNGDFEQPNLGGAVYQTFSMGQTIGGAWQVTQGNVDLINAAFFVGTGQSVDMAGFLSGTIQQTVAPSGTGLYHLTFDMAGNPGGTQGIKTLLVSLGGQSKPFTFDTTGHTTSSMGWTTMSWDINFGAATVSPLILSFADQNGATLYGAALDNVVLTDEVDGVAVPEPTTCIAGALLLLPFGASAMRNLRRKQAA